MGMDLKDLANIAVASSSAGFGASAGRAAYKDLSKNWPLYIIVAVCFLGVGYAFFDASRGHDRSAAKSFFITGFTNVFIFIFSIIVSIICFSLVKSSNTGFPWGTWWFVQIVSGIVGLSIGLSQRSGRLKSFEIAEKNEIFLQELGLRSLGGTENTWMDADNNELKMIDVRDDAIVFRVQGRRGVRALLKWDEIGQFTEFCWPKH